MSLHAQRVAMFGRDHAFALALATAGIVAACGYMGIDSVTASDIRTAFVIPGDAVDVDDSHPASEFRYARSSSGGGRLNPPAAAQAYEDPWRSPSAMHAAAIESLLVFPAEETSLPLVFVGGVTAPAAPRVQVQRRVIAHTIATTGHLEEVFRSLDYSLAVVRQGEPVPALRLDRIPTDLAQQRAGVERIEIFIKTVLPLVLQTNEAILADRHELIRLRDKRAAAIAWTAVERSWLVELADRYACESDNLAELLRRVDVVPPSMALAQGGVESGWGTSYAARVGNSLFGQIGGRGMIPQAFGSIGESVESYILNLNSHPAYAAFRNDRAQLRMLGASLDGHRLIGHLTRYSELGAGYIGFVRQVMRENRMNEFDEARLSPL